MGRLQKPSLLLSSSRQHLILVLNVHFSRSLKLRQLQGAELNEPRARETDASGNLQLENACPVDRHSNFSYFSFVVKNKTNKKKDMVPSKTHLWARIRQLITSERVTNKSKDIQRRMIRIWNNSVVCSMWNNWVNWDSLIWKRVGLREPGGCLQSIWRLLYREDIRDVLSSLVGWNEKNRSSH